MKPRPPLPPLDVAPLKDMARSLRFIAEQGSRTLRNSLPLQALPDPGAQVAETALSTVLHLGQKAQRGVSRMAHAILDSDEPLPPLSAADQAEARFAAAVHDGLRAGLAQLGAETVLISETAVQQAWRRVARSGSGPRDSATAAALFLALQDPPALREAIWSDRATMAPDQAGRIALFAVLLAMLCDAAGYRALLPACVDLALALRADLSGPADAARLETLFDEFRDHV